MWHGFRPVWASSHPGSADGRPPSPGVSAPAFRHKPSGYGSLPGTDIFRLLLRFLCHRNILKY